MCRRSARTAPALHLRSERARELAKSAIDDFLQALKSTLEAGVMDGGAVLNMAPNSLTLVAGGFVGDPGKVDFMDAATFALRTLGFVNAPALMQRVVAEIQDTTVDVSEYRKKRDFMQPDPE